tara:strand:+ start:125346 stop:125774 length:429 start_codon:yes stop_codon:yes gene_type:complete
MEIKIDPNAKTHHIQASRNPDQLPDFIAQCSSVDDRELLLDMAANTLEPKRAPDLLDFVGRSYQVLEKNKKFQEAVQRFFRDVIWKRFQKVVWSEEGTVGLDVPIEDRHVKTFLKVAHLPSTSAKYVDNVRKFLTDQAQNVR